MCECVCECVQASIVHMPVAVQLPRVHVLYKTILHCILSPYTKTNTPYEYGHSVLGTPIHTG